jgi:hypothetical protein
LTELIFFAILYLDDKNNHRQTKIKNKIMFFRKGSEERLQLNQLGHATWRSYRSLRKKAMGQEFTWRGFFISLSIAFLIVGSASSSLNVLYENLALSAGEATGPDKVYMLEKAPLESLALVQTC